MGRIKIYPKSLENETGFLKSGAEFRQSRLIRLRNAPCAGNLCVERHELRNQFAFLLLFGSSHRFREADAAGLQDIQEHARLRAFGADQGFRSPSVCNKQVSHSEIGVDLGFKETLLLLFYAGDLTAQPFDDVNRLFEGLICLLWLVQMAMSYSGINPSVQENLKDSHLPGERHCAFSEVDRFRMPALFT